MMNRYSWEDNTHAKEFEDFDGATPLKFLAKSLMVLADADAVYFADGWRETRGCRIENRCAVAYGLNIIKD